MGIKSIESRVNDIEIALSNAEERSSDMATAFFQSHSYDKVWLPPSATDLETAIGLVNKMKLALIKNEICDGDL
jgi:hypothetical protein